MRRRKQGQSVKVVESNINRRGVSSSRDDEVPSSAFTSVYVTFVLLLVSRLLSARYNLIHDCDETYNYWEPLHFFLYKEGFQTWEYSPEFSLRSYLYIYTHFVVAKVLQGIALFMGYPNAKLFVFYGLRVTLGTVSAYTETMLVQALQRNHRKKQSMILFFLLMTSSGMFVASSGFLPGTFSMYCFTLAASGVLLKQFNLVIIACIVSVIVGWSVTAVAAVPYALWVLYEGKFIRDFSTAIISISTLGALTFFLDSFYYGKQTISLVNFLSYNVFGSGDSSLYGVEDFKFYFKNGINNLNIVLPLSLCSPLLFIANMLFKRGKSHGLSFVACCASWVWFAAISYLPHKEERFLYVVYPIMCMAAAEAIVQSVEMMQKILRGKIETLANLSIFAILVMSSALSACRVSALIHNYGASMTVYHQMNHHSTENFSGDSCKVCVGSEWYEFPSTFLLPSECSLHFVESGFDGILPSKFNASLGGTRYGDAYLNDRNKGDSRQYIDDESKCKYLVKLMSQSEIDQDVQGHQVLFQDKYVDSAASKALYRALYIPYISPQKLAYKYYTLLKKF